jgi:hypothetical protein
MRCGNRKKSTVVYEKRKRTSILPCLIATQLTGAMDTAKLCFSKETLCCPHPASEIFNNRLSLQHQTQFGRHEDFVREERLASTRRFCVEEFLVRLVRSAHPKFMWRRMTDANRQSHHRAVEHGR